jgi:hypothetical protein
VSLATDIIQLFGSSSVPVVVFGSVLGVFELGERLASQRAKDALSRWLLTFNVRQAGALPDGTQELFAIIFGKRHFSLKCFVRSVAFSLGAMAFIGILCLSISPNVFFSNLIDKPGWLWLLWNIIIDYISLFKTRVILRTLTRMQLVTTVVAIAILVMDFLLYTILFGIGAMIIGTLYVELFLLPDLGNPIYIFLAGLSVERLTRIVLTPVNPDWFFFIFFWAGFAPSLWMWLYILALFVTRALLRSERIVNWLRWFLDVEKNPFRSIGAVAAALALIASVAILLISAEVSRISAAA